MFKFFLASTAVAFFTLVSGMMGCTAYFASGGMATVSVETPDVDLWIPVPTRLFDLGMDAAWVAIPEQDRLALHADMERELRNLDVDVDVAKVVREITSDIAHMPNGALVEVKSDDAYVWVGKVGGKFQVKVDAPDAKVKVSVPARAAHRVTERALEFAGI